VVNLEGLGGADQHDRVPAICQSLDQVARSLQRLDLVDELLVEVTLGLSNAVAPLPLDRVARHGAHELVPAHADVAVDTPERHHDAVAPERPVPGERVMVVGVDERAVDVE
jgi:hypothetical protein